MIEYKHTKEIEVEKIRQLFESVGWYSSRQPQKIQQAFRNSSKVISAWEGEKLVGLVRGLDDGVWQATIDCLLVLPEMQGKGIASELLMFFATPKYLKLQNAFPKVAAGNSSFLHVSPA